MEEFPLLMEYQKKYGKRGSEAASLWLLRKRTLNIACMVVSKVKNINFENFTLALYFRCDDKEMLPVTGITADFINAGFIRKIIFIEIVYNDEMILLYRVITKGNGELSGYYQTKSQT